jgi:hypothetical protein
VRVDSELPWGKGTTNRVKRKDMEDEVRVRNEQSAGQTHPHGLKSRWNGERDGKDKSRGSA